MPEEITDPKEKALLTALSESGVMVRPSITRALRGNGNASMVLCQLLWFAGQKRDEGAWFEYSNADISRGTGLGKDSIATTIHWLSKFTLVEEEARKGLPRRLRINRRALLDLIYKQTQPKQPATSKLTETSDNEVAGDAPPVVAGDAPPVVAGDAPPVSFSRNIRSVETHASEKRTRRRAPRNSSPRYRSERGMLCPEEFAVTPEMRAWAERTLPPATLARLDDLTRRFIRKRRVEQQTYFPDHAAVVASWEGYMESCGENDLKAAAEGRGRRYVEEEVPAPTYAQLVAAGHVPPVPSVPVAQVRAAAPLDDKCPSF